jgi:iron-sulfur cluster assembly accessory protein
MGLREIPMVQLTETAISKVREILDTQEPKPAGLRIAVVGGGCSGFSYSMAFENSPGMLDKTYTFDGLKVYVDQALVPGWRPGGFRGDAGRLVLQV